MTDILVATKYLSHEYSLRYLEKARQTPLMWSVNDVRSSSLMVCDEFVPAVPFTEILPLFVSSLLYQIKHS